MVSGDLPENNSLNNLMKPEDLEKITNYHTPEKKHKSDAISTTSQPRKSDYYLDFKQGLKIKEYENIMINENCQRNLL